METIKVSTSQHIDIDYAVAGLGERIAARLIDLAFFGLLSFLIVMFSLIPGISAGPTITFIFIIYGAFYAFYNLLCEIFMDGQSVGKRMMKIKVISIDGGQATFGQFMIRWVFRLVDFVLTAQVGGLVCVAVSEKKQRIGDMVAGTTLIKMIPKTKFEHIAFHPVDEAYVPYFMNANLLSDEDIELINEVLGTYYKTGNSYLLYTAVLKVADMLSLQMPREENRLDFLEKLIKDYNYLTAQT